MTKLSKLNRILLGAAVAVGSAVAFTGVARADADLGIALVSPKTLELHGQPITFEADVKNAGPDKATGAKLTAVTVPATWTLTVANCTPVTQGQVGPLPCILTGAAPAAPGEIAAQETVKATVTLTPPVTCPNPDEKFTTTVTIASDADTNATNDSAVSKEFSNQIYQDLAVEMVAPTEAGYGDYVDVQVKVSNVAGCTAHGVLIDDEQFATSKTMKFLGTSAAGGAPAACTIDPTKVDADGNPVPCELGDLNRGDTREWTIHYQIVYPSSLMTNPNTVSLTVYSFAEDFLDPNPNNDVATTTTPASRSQSGCSTGELGGALSLLALGVPFLRRRRKS